jgi:hypothetical protein
MLSTFTSPISSRRRGAQPGNNNAHKHGFYARRHPSPALQQFTQIKHLQQSAIFASRSRHLGLAGLHVQALQELLIDNFLAADDIHLGPQTLVKIERFYRTVSATLRAKRALKQLYDELDFLPSLARDVLPLCTAEFTDRRISQYAYYGHANELFVPPLLQKNRALTNGRCERSDRGAFPRKAICSPTGFAPLGPSHSESSAVHSQSAGTPRCPPSTDAYSLFTVNRQPTTDNCLPTTDNCLPTTDHWFSLTSDQWTLIEPILTSHRIQLAEMGIRPRTRIYSDRFLIESILTRLAFGLSWDELRGQIPVRACQLLYKQLCTSGRMRLIYELLHQHLLTEGGISLTTIACDGSFSHTDDRIFPAGEQSITWQHLTALLLLQRALYNRRRIKRAEAQARRHQGRYERAPSIFRQRSPRRPAENRSRDSHHAPQPIPGLISILDCRSTDPLLCEKFRSISGSSP